jgi:hypothetical protein
MVKHNPGALDDIGRDEQRLALQQLAEWAENWTTDEKGDATVSRCITLVSLRLVQARMLQGQMREAMAAEAAP